MVLRHGLRLFSRSRRRTVSPQRLSCSASRTISSPGSARVQQACPAGGFEQALVTSRTSSLPVSLRCAPGRGAADCPRRNGAWSGLQSTCHTPPVRPSRHRGHLYPQPEGFVRLSDGVSSVSHPQAGPCVRLLRIGQAPGAIVCSSRLPNCFGCSDESFKR